jgi:hypothetical protein
MLSVVLPAVLEDFYKKHVQRLDVSLLVVLLTTYDLNYRMAFMSGSAGVPTISQYRKVFFPDVPLASVQRYHTFRTHHTAHLLTGLPEDCHE